MRDRVYCCCNITLPCAILTFHADSLLRSGPMLISTGSSKYYSGSDNNILVAYIHISIIVLKQRHKNIARQLQYKEPLRALPICNSGFLMSYSVSRLPIYSVALLFFELHLVSVCSCHSVRCQKYASCTSRHFSVHPDRALYLHNTPVIG